MMTAKTWYPLTPRGIRRANKDLTKLLRIMKRESPGMNYVSFMDLTKNRRRIHFHILCDGPMLKKSRLKKRWQRISSHFHLHIKPAHSNHPHYLAKRVSELPNIKDSNAPAWRGVYDFVFQRVRVSKNLFPQEHKKKSDAESPWVLYYDPEQLGYRSVEADIATPREAGDTADHPLLSGVQHGHDGKRRRQGVLVQGVWARVGRWGSNGDSRELDASNEAAGRALLGAAK